MKPGEKRKGSGPFGRAEKMGRPVHKEAVSLLQVHPIPQSGQDVLSVAAHLVRRFAAEQRRDVPGISRDAEKFLAGHVWVLDDLSRRLWLAVANNRGNLITALDLSD